MLTQIPYNREKAVEYARKWALSRNPLFVDFTGGGGNCTNFVSQSILAGCGIMDFTPTFGWYYRTINDRAPAWSGVDELYGYLTGSGGFAGQDMAGPFATEVRQRRQIEIGDVIQLANGEGAFYHTLIISGFEGSDILICAHSDDALDRRLSTYNYASLRVLHIEGVLVDLPQEIAFQNLFDGTVLQVIGTDVMNVV
jgi:hypothetical protein